MAMIVNLRYFGGGHVKCLAKCDSVLEQSEKLAASELEKAPSCLQMFGGMCAYLLNRCEIVTF